MNSKVLEVLLTLKDQLTEKMNTASGAIGKFGNEVGKFGTTLRAAGREISQIGMSMTMLGAAITAPLLLAYKTAGDYSFEVHKSMTDLKVAFTELSVSVGTSLAPIMQNFANVIQNLVDRWKALSPEVRDHIIQTAYLAGQYLVIGGIALTVFGRILQVIANVCRLIRQELIPAIQSVIWYINALLAGFEAHPIVWILTIIGLIIIAMWKWKAVGDAVLNVFTLIGQAVQVMAYAMMGNWKMATQAAQGFVDTIKTTVTGGQTPLAKGFDDLKIKTGDWFNKIKDVGLGIKQIEDLTKNLDSNYQHAARTVGTFWGGFKMSIYDSIYGDAGLKFWVTEGTKSAQQLSSSMQSSFKSFFVDAFTGQLKTAQDYFTEFGKKIIDIFANVISDMITRWIESGIWNIFASMAGGGGGLSYAFDLNPNAGMTLFQYHSGGMVRRAHSGYLASDEVPIIAQAGEGILSRKGMAALGTDNFNALNNGSGGGGQGSVVVYMPIQAWDYRDVYRNRQVIAQGLIDEIRKRGPLRTAMKDYK